MTCTPVRLILPVLLLLVTPAWANFSVISSDGFSYCYFLAENNSGQSCVDSEFAPGGSCAAGCGVDWSSGEVSGVVPWEVQAETNVQGGDALAGTDIGVVAVRVSSDMLTLSGLCDSTSSAPEIALFRYAGDPSVFDGTAAVSVLEFVDMGLIAAQDVLVTYDCFTGGPNLNIDVDVSGIPDNELVLFAGSDEPAGFSPPVVPAVSLMGAAVLALLVLGLGAIALRKAV
jgi:hypothetical protein